MAKSFVNSDNFLAVALIINRSRDGPAFVFHYPPRVSSGSDNEGARDGADLEDILLERLSQPASRGTVPGGPSSQWDGNGHDMNDSTGTKSAPWEHVAGFPTRDLAGILTPARSYHKSLFQLSLDPLLCVSYPIHVPQNGKWKKQKKASKTRAPPAAEEQGAPNDPDSSAKAADTAMDQDGEREKDKDTKADEAEEEKRSSMTMFNLVFILHPGKSGKASTREIVETLYVHIVKKANKAYMYSQQHSDFVWKESKRILSAKDKAREDSTYHWLS